MKSQLWTKRAMWLPEPGTALKLRDYQRAAVDAVHEALGRGVRRQLISLPTGAGKCLGLGTPVLRYDGTIVPVESVRAGDSLMGPDSLPRRVVSTTRGSGALYRIVPVRGEPWVCNDVHVLSLVHTQTGEIVDIDLPSYLAESRNFRHLHKQFAPPRGVDFAPLEATLPVDPYFLGIWLGDGLKRLDRVAISKPDQEIRAAVAVEAARWGLTVREDNSKSCPTFYVHGERGAGNPLMQTLRAIIPPDYSIPRPYLVASRPERLRLLAGIVDTDGYVQNNSLEIVQKIPGLADGVAFIARSLGFRVMRSVKVVNGDSYQRLSISGDLSAIPARIARKQGTPRRQLKCATRTGFTVEPIGDGEYAGFELDGDGRFLLGDFTVTHNTFVAAHLVSEIGRRTVFMVHRDELARQTVTQMRQVNPALSIGVCKAEQDEVHEDIVVASAQTLAHQSRLDRLVAGIGPNPLFISDEAHHDRSPTRMRAIDAIVGEGILVGLTATPKRGDKLGLDAVYEEIVYHLPMRTLVERKHLARPVGLRIETESDLDSVHTVAGEFNERELANEVDTDPRNRLIVESWKTHAADRKRTVVFCVTVRHAERVRDAFRAEGISAEMVDGGTPVAERQRIFAEFALGNVKVLTNCMVLTEGFDEPGIDCAIMARPTKSSALYIQCLDLDTEILTPRGFLGPDELRDSDPVAGVDPATGAMRWLPQKGRVRRSVYRDERMVVLENPSLDIRVTAGHRMLVREGSPKFLTAGELVGRGGKTYLPVSAVEDVPDCELTDAECRFLGWFLSDGNLNPLNNQITISQATSQPQIHELRRVLRACGFRFGDNSRQHPERPETTMAYFTISKGQPRRKADAGLRGWDALGEWLTPSRRLTPAYERLSARQFALVLEGLHLGNGSKQRGQQWTRRSYHISFGEIAQAEQVQSLAVRRGWRSHISTRSAAGGWGRKPVVVLHAKRLAWAYLQGRPADSRPTWREEEPRPGEEVWCVENELQTLIVRRNGKVAVVGNCVGRALRFRPDKPDALIIDMVDVTSRHQLVTLPSLSGSELQGKEREVTEADRLPGQAMDLFDALSHNGKLREREAIMLDLLDDSPFVWQSLPDGTWMSPAGMGRWVTLLREGEEFVPVRIIMDRGEPPAIERLLDRPVAADIAMGIATDHIPLSVLNQREAHWRRRPATDRQKSAAARWRVPVRNGATAGELSDLIDMAAFRAAQKKLFGRAS